MKNKIFSLVITLIMTANAGFCTETRADLIIKFSIAMVGVMLASVVIWAGLAIYNGILAKTKTSSIENEILKTPKTIDEAVKFFINKNRLGFGLLDLLIGLLIMTAVFMIGANAFKGITPVKTDTKSIQEHVDETVNEIENMREQSIDYQKQMLNNVD